MSKDLSKLDEMLEIEVFDFEAEEIAENAAIDALEDAPPENVPWAGLTDLQRRFCEEYVRNGWQQGKAYHTVNPNASKGTANVYAHRLLKKSKIRHYIKHLHTEADKLAGVSKARNMQRLANIAYTNMGDVLNGWFEFKDFGKLPRPVKDAIKDVKIQQGMNGSTIQIKMHDSVAAVKELNAMSGYNEATKIAIEAPVIFPNRPRPKRLE